MSSCQILQSIVTETVPDAEWFAVQTKPRHEKTTAVELAQKGINTFLPLLSEMRQWSDRRKNVELPLFSCYVFVNMIPSAEARVSVLRSRGVLSFVGNGKEPISIPDSQIDDVRRLLAAKVPFMAHPFLHIGQRVRIRGGALDGVEGILTRRSGATRLVISVETIQRSLSISVEGYDVEPVGERTYRA
jgi:transcription antitermination factor NusG